MKRTSTLLFLALTAHGATHGCSCGYTTTSPRSKNSAAFTEILETDFLRVSHYQSAWIAQAYNVTPTGSRGSYGKSAQVGNVISNPIPSPHDWGGVGVHGSDPGLELWSRAGLVDIPGTDGKMIPIAEMVSTRNDILYGSFRIGLKTTDVNGTCGAFFFYRNDSSEIDLEFLSSQPQAVNLVIQSPESVARGYVDHSSQDFDQHALEFEPGERYNEYRFDWLPGRVDFYANGKLLRTARQNVPDTKGSLHVIHWSNGDEGWSGGPPERDAKMVVSYVKAYFNSSDTETTEQSLRGCKARGKRCEVPNQDVPPDPSGNGTGRTFFFTEQNPGEGDDGGGGDDGGDDAATTTTTTMTGVAARVTNAWLGVISGVWCLVL